MDLAPGYSLESVLRLPGIHYESNLSREPSFLFFLSTFNTHNTHWLDDNNSMDDNNSKLSSRHVSQARGFPNSQI